MFMGEIQKKIFFFFSFFFLPWNSCANERSTMSCHLFLDSGETFGSFERHSSWGKVAIMYHFVWPRPPSWNSDLAGVYLDFYPHVADLCRFFSADHDVAHLQPRITLTAQLLQRQYRTCLDVSSGSSHIPAPHRVPPISLLS